MEMGIAAACQKCAVRQRAVCAVLSDSTLARLVRRRHIPVGNLILDGEDEPGGIGVILSGVVKLLKTAADGRRQIVALQFPGQFIRRPGAKTAPFLAEAASEVVLCCFPSTSFEALMREHRGLERAIMHQTQDELDLAREWLFVLGRKTAQEKVASLLLHVAHQLSLAGRCGVGTPGSADFDLPLSRAEMAEYLGLTIETVSRQISILKAHGVFDIRGARHVSIPDLAVLKTWSECDQT